MSFLAEDAAASAIASALRSAPDLHTIKRRLEAGLRYELARRRAFEIDRNGAAEERVTACCRAVGALSLFDEHHPRNAA